MKLQSDFDRPQIVLNSKLFDKEHLLIPKNIIIAL